VLPKHAFQVVSNIIIPTTHFLLFLSAKRLDKFGFTTEI
jgi:hypothetical protein